MPAHLYIIQNYIYSVTPTPHERNLNLSSECSSVCWL